MSVSAETHAAVSASPGSRRQSVSGPSPSKAGWVPDSASKVCTMCAEAFSMMRRRHHCRYCGRLLCAQCSPHKIDGQRSCGSCAANRTALSNGTPAVAVMSEDDIPATRPSGHQRSRTAYGGGARDHPIISSPSRDGIVIGGERVSKSAEDGEVSIEPDEPDEESLIKKRTDHELLVAMAAQMQQMGHELALVNAQKRGLQEEVEILSEGLKSKSAALKASEAALETARSELRDLRQQLADHRELRDLKSRLTQIESIAFSSSSFSPSPHPVRSGTSTPHNGSSRSGSPERPVRSVTFQLPSPPSANGTSNGNGAPSSSPPRVSSPPLARVTSPALPPLREEDLPAAALPVPVMANGTSSAASSPTSAPPAAAASPPPSA